MDYLQQMDFGALMKHPFNSLQSARRRRPRAPPRQRNDSSVFVGSVGIPSIRQHPRRWREQNSYAC